MEADDRVKAPRAPKRTSPDLLDYAQVGDRLNVHEATVRRMVDMGKIKSVPVTPSGRRRMVRVVDLEAYLEDNAGYRHAPVEPARAPPPTRRRWITPDGIDHLGYTRGPKK